MATISGATNERVYTIPRWLGLNEHPDGDTKMKFGEASKMVNWKITRDGNLKRRPGTEFVAGLCSSYEVVIEPDIQRITEIKDGDVIAIYTAATAMGNPGKIVLIGMGASIVNGTLYDARSTVSGGVFQIDADTTASVEDGVLTLENTAFSFTLEELEERLAELEDGEYLYVRYLERPYAIDQNSIVRDSGHVYLAGYLVSEKPVSATPTPIAGLWTGLVAGQEVLLAACDGKLWSLYDAETGNYVREVLGSLRTDKGVSFFPFGGSVYILNGYEYYQYDGSNFSTVDGYVPLVAVSISPVIDGDGNSESGETTSEYVNRLNGKRRVWISPDGERATFPLPEKNVQGIDHVKYTADGTEIPSTDYMLDSANGQVTFTTVPAKSVNSIEIAYTMVETYRAQVTGNLFAEIFSGPTDNLVFLYGNGSNQAIYSGMDYDGMPRADYFPDTYTVNVGDSNTPLTSMIRHYGDLVCYKTDSTWAITQSSMELVSGDQTIAIYCTPVNRDKGNVAPGQVRLVDNNPVTCSGSELYHWVNSSYYTSTLSRDERQARRISDRIQKSIKEIDFPSCCMWDDNDNQEFYICSNGVALVWNYAADAWYRYEGFDVVKMCSFHGDVILGTSEGLVTRLGYGSKTDLGVPIKAEWVSGAIDFGAAYERKYSSMLWVVLKPETGTSVDVCVETDRKNTFRDKVISSEKAKIKGQPFATRTKIKAKKFVYYRLMLSVEDYQPAVTVTDVEIRVRQTGYAK